MMRLLLVLIYAIIGFEFAYSGNLQGGGGGPQNISVKRYLDKRTYSLGGASRHIAPKVNVVNACEHENTINTIKKVWICNESVIRHEHDNSSDSFSRARNVKTCLKNVKKHLKFSIPKPSPKCLASEAQLIRGEGVKEVCVQWDQTKMKSFPLTYKLDVYQMSIGDGGTPLYPNVDKDTFVRTINYHIPKCIDVTKD